MLQKNLIRMKLVSVMFNERCVLSKRCENVWAAESEEGRRWEAKGERVEKTEAQQREGGGGKSALA